MNRIRRSFARLTGTSEPWVSQLTGPAAHRTGRSRRDGFARQFIQDMAAAAYAAAGHQLGRRSRGNRSIGGARWAPRPASAAPGPPPAAQDRPTTTTPAPRRRTRARPGWLPRTLQLCIHCQKNPAGFWVSHNGGQTVRRPWCLACCQQLDRDRYDVIAFDS